MSPFKAHGKNKKGKNTEGKSKCSKSGHFLMTQYMMLGACYCAHAHASASLLNRYYIDLNRKLQRSQSFSEGNTQSIKHFMF